jgi:hypothetical protein
MVVLTTLSITSNVLRMRLRKHVLIYENFISKYDINVLPHLFCASQFQSVC